MSNKYINNPFFYLFQLYHEFSFIIGKLNKVRVYLWGIKIGKDSKFKGHCYFKRFKDSKIIIGNKFTAISTSKAPNLIYRPCTIMTSKEHAELIIGNNVGMSGTVIACFKKITIGNNVRIGANCFIFDGDFHLNDKRVMPPKEVKIEDNVWLGMNVTILKGVTIGENSIIGAGSIVSQSIPSNVIAAGNPCKIIRQLK